MSERCDFHNRLIVAHTGTVNLATGELVVEARRLG